jgi:phage shock protein PspC (stress-responsive transcriptional regulator)
MMQPAVVGYVIAWLIIPEESAAEPYQGVRGR